jgi:hypothetical protein
MRNEVKKQEEMWMERRRAGSPQRTAHTTRPATWAYGQARKYHAAADGRLDRNSTSCSSQSTPAALDSRWFSSRIVCNCSRSIGHRLGRVCTCRSGACWCIFSSNRDRRLRSACRRSICIGGSRRGCCRCRRRRCGAGGQQLRHERTVLGDFCAQRSDVRFSAQMPRWACTHPCP